MFQRGTTHVCAIENETSQTYLPQLPPNANPFRRFLNFLKKLILVAEYNPSSVQYYRKTLLIIEERRKQIQANSWVIHPFSVFRLFYEMWMVFLYTLCLFYMPLYGVFLFMLSLDFVGFHYFLSICCYIDVLLNFFTGRAIDETETLMKPLKIAKLYIFGPHFIFDMISSLPDLRPILAPGSIEYIGMLSFFKIVRIFTFFTYLERTLTFSSLKKLLIQLTILCMLVLHYVALLTIYTSKIYLYMQGITTLEHEYGFWEFLHMYLGIYYDGTSLLLSIETNYLKRGFTPRWLNTICMCFIYIIGKVALAFVIVIILDIIRTNSLLETRYHEMMSQVDGFMSTQKLPDLLQTRIRGYYEFKYHKKYTNQSKIDKYISDKLKKEIKVSECQQMIRNVKIFKPLPQQIVEDLVSYLKLELFMPGDVIVQSGVKGDCLYFISTGTVTVRSPSGKEICHLQDGDYFGELCLLYSTKRSATVIAVENCELYMLEKKHFKNYLAGHPDVMKIMKSEATRRYEMTKAVERAQARTKSASVLFSREDFKNFQ